jgi:hypothetical protein
VHAVNASYLEDNYIQTNRAIFNNLEIEKKTKLSYKF